MQNISLSDIRQQVDTLQIAERFFDSVVLFALFEVGVFRQLAEGPKSLEHLQDTIKGDMESLRATLDAGVALGILTKQEENYAAEEALLNCLGRNSSNYLGEWVSFLHALAKPLLELGTEIREGSKPGALYENNSEDDLPARLCTRAMDAYARSRGVELADRLDFSKTSRFLDLGCGPGTYSLAIVESHPNVTATLLDLPGPIEKARKIVAERNMQDRVQFVSCDARDYEPEEPFDTMLVSNMLHMLGPEASNELIQRCAGMLETGGRLIIQAQFLNDDRVSPRWATLLNLLQRVATPNGRNHALEESSRWMQDAGFTDIQHIRMSSWNVNSCLVGTKS